MSELEEGQPTPGVRVVARTRYDIVVSCIATDTLR